MCHPVSLFWSPLPLLEDRPASMAAPVLVHSPLHSSVCCCAEHSFGFSLLILLQRGPFILYLYICIQNSLPFELVPILMSPFLPFHSIPLSPSRFNAALDFSAWYNLSVSRVVMRFSCLQTYLFSGIPWYYLYMHSLLRSSLFNLVPLITSSLLSL